MDKSPDAFRTISEVADWLGTPTHVLRFWESRFTQVKPVKRAGGRRYYRPADMELLGGIKKLLHDDGMTIRGVQKLLREEGIKHVAALSQPLDAAAAGDRGDALDGTSVPAGAEASEDAAAPMLADAPQDDPDNVVPLSRTLAEAEAGRRGASPLSEARADPPADPAPDPAAALRDGRQRDLLDDLPAAEAPAAAPAQEEQDAPAQDADADAAPAADASDGSPEPQEAPPGPSGPIPAQVDVPADPGDDDLAPPKSPDLAAMLRRARARPAADRPDPALLAPLHDRLAALRDRMIAK